jgi:tetratricopeptide (TPR) repeat protein
VVTPIHHRLSLALALVALAAGGALAACSEGQMAEAQLQFQGAQALLQQQQWQQAVPQLQSIVDFCPEYVPALRGLGLAQEQLGQYDQAADAYSQVIAVMGKDAEAADYANLAKVYTRQKKYKEARAEYLKAQARDPHNCAVLVNLGILHNASGYPVMAVDTLEDALGFCPELQGQILPHLAKASTAAAAQQKKIGNTEKADMYTRKAQQYGGSAGGSTAYAQIQQAMQQGDYAKTVSLCEQLLAKEPENANAWLTKARAADAAGQQQVSIDAYRNYLELRPENIDETAAMIIVMAEAGECDSAVAKAREASQHFSSLGSKAMGKIQFAHGKALFCAEQYEAARVRFQEAAGSGDAKWVSAAREGIAACDKNIDYQAAKQRQAQQGG